MAAFYAETTHARIESQIMESQNELKEGQSLSVEFILADGRKIIPNYIGYHNIMFIVLYGEDEHGNEIKILLHHTNAQVVITKLNKPQETKKIGFQQRTERD